MPEVDYVVLSEWFDWIVKNIDVSIDLIGETVPPWPPSPGPSEEVVGWASSSRGGGQGPHHKQFFPCLDSAFSQRADRIWGFWSLLEKHPGQFLKLLSPRSLVI